MERENELHVSSQAFNRSLSTPPATKQEWNGKYPFPETQWRAWWDQCHPQVKKTWAPILRAMTAEEREEMHTFRKTRSFSWPDTTPAGRTEREQAEIFLLRHWRSRMGSRFPEVEW